MNDNQNLLILDWTKFGLILGTWLTVNRAHLNNRSDNVWIVQQKNIFLSPENNWLK